MTSPVIQICYSDDGGRNWSNWREIELGLVGEYKKRQRIRRLGSARQRVWKIRCAEPLTVDVLGAVAALEGAEN